MHTFSNILRGVGLELLYLNIIRFVITVSKIKIICDHLFQQLYHVEKSKPWNLPFESRVELKDHPTFGITLFGPGQNQFLGKMQRTIMTSDLRDRHSEEKTALTGRRSADDIRRGIPRDLFVVARVKLRNFTVRNHITTVPADEFLALICIHLFPKAPISCFIKK